MPRWSYTEVSYSPSSLSWQEIGGSDQAGRVNARSWLSQICNHMGKESWEFATVIQDGKDYRLLFKRHD